MQRFTTVLALYIAGGAVAVNVAGNMMANTAQALEQRQADRTEQLCQVNRIYCD